MENNEKNTSKSKGRPKGSTNKPKIDNNEIAELKSLVAAVLQDSANKDRIIEELRGKSNKSEFDSDPLNINRPVPVMHMDDLTDGLFTELIGDTTYSLQQFGSVVRIRLGELEKIVAKQRKFFERGIVKILDDDIVDHFGLRKFYGAFIDKNVYENIIELSVDELSKLFKSICDTHKNMIVRKWTREVMEGKDTRYSDPAKIAVLAENDNKIRNILDVSNLVRSHMK